MAQEPPAYCVANFTVTNPESMAEYGKLAGPIMLRFGGRMLSSDGGVTRLEGEPGPVIVIIEFPNLQAFFHSPEYAAVKHLRTDATEGGFLVLSKGLASAE
jgi:uncharacterized protein (DUF1330 family)